MKKIIPIFGAIFLCATAVPILGQATEPRDYSVLASAEVNESPPEIRLVWPAGRFTTGYAIARRGSEGESWMPLAELPGEATSYTDTDVEPGRGYEYQFITTTSRGFTGYDYIYAGINLPMEEDRGGVLLIVDSTKAEELRPELARLARDLIGDGWTVWRLDVAPSETAERLKAAVRGVYDRPDTNLKALFLLGNIPVAYSGNIAPDDHKHQGAQPADVFLAHLDGQHQWTDITVHSLVAERQINRNVPGDGKYDQSYPPTEPLVASGRVDFSDLPAFQRTEVELLRDYLDKNHRFRHGMIQAERRGLMADFLPKGHIAETTHGDGDPVGGSGWRNFASFFGAENIQEIGQNQFFNTTEAESYLWAFGSVSTREFTEMPGIGSAADFAARSPNVIFTMFVGGFFGDWKIENNFLRSALGSGDILTTSYSGLPHWMYHHMALGKHIGHSALLTQKNRRGGSYPPINDGAGQVHITLLGDPSLRMHPVRPPSEPRLEPIENGFRVGWNSSPEDGIQGYLVYRAPAPAGPFQRISGENLVTGTSFEDSFGAGDRTYMIRAVKREQSGGGTYLNPSQGLIISSGSPRNAPLITPDNVQASAISSSQALLSWRDAGFSTSGFRIERRDGAGEFAEVGTIEPGVTVFADAGLAPDARYTYRMRSFNGLGNSDYSSEMEVQTPPEQPRLRPAQVEFVGMDNQTRGNWDTRYGELGRYVIAKEDRVIHAAPSMWPVDPIIPSDVILTHSGRENFVWDEWSTDPRSLRRMPGSEERMLAAWYAPQQFSVDFTITGERNYLITLYFLDWDNQNRAQRVRWLAQDGAVLDERMIESYHEGRYYTWRAQGPVRAEFTRESGPNVLLTGIFFDPADPVAGNGELVMAIVLQNGSARVLAAGTDGEVMIESSTNLADWTPAGTISIVHGSGQMAQELALDENRYFRARRME